MNNYSIKIDDLLLYMLKECYGISVSEAMSFFTDRSNEMRSCVPNITENSRPSNISFNGLDSRTIQSKRYYHKPHNNTFGSNYYVLRGFFPNTNVPFKMTTVIGKEGNNIYHCKITIGMKPHFSIIQSEKINAYKERVCEAILIDQPAENVEEIPYISRDFKCMRPKGMELYREKNYEEKRKKKARESTRKRKLKKENNDV